MSTKAGQDHDWRGSASGRSSFSYYDDGRKKDQTLPTGAFSTWNYNTAGWLTKVEHKTSSTGSVFARFEYLDYDLAGNREEQKDFDGTNTQIKTFQYDPLHRPEKEVFAGTTTEYVYDESGNRTSLKVNTVPVKTYAYDDDNRLKTIVDGTGTTSFGYDKNGSITSKAVPVIGTTSYTYDAARRLSTVFPAGGSQTTFTYDGNGARKSKSAASGTSTYVNDTRSLTQVLQETKGTNTLSYVAGLSQFDPSQSGNAQWAYFHSDHQNNRVLTDGGGLVSKRWEYDPFGVVRSETGSGSSDFGYAGEQKDGETGLINLRARYYDPAIARFMSRDALGGTVGFPQSYNRFAYSVNNPLRYVDPSGYEHCAVDDEGNPVYCHPDPNDAEENDDEWEAQQEENNQEIVEYCIQGVLQCERISESHAADVLEDYADRRDNPGEDLEPDDDPDCTQPGNPRMCGMPTPVCFGGKCFLVFGIAKDILGGGGGGDAAEKATLAISKGRAIQAAGAAREARFLKQLAEQGVEGEILTQRYLRRADKSIITDTATGESRRLDVVVVKNGEVVAIYEVASPKANKLGQTQKTQRIISDNDGAYVLDPKTSELVWVPPKIKETVVRVP